MRPATTHALIALGPCAADLRLGACGSTAAGITYVVGAGNDSVDIDTFAPAGYDEVLTASAMTDTDGRPGALGPSSCPGFSDDTVAFFSNFATLSADQSHTVAAPGTCIGSTYLNGGYGAEPGPASRPPMWQESPPFASRRAEPRAGLTPTQIVQKLVADATAYNTANPGYGFLGDPLHSPDPHRYYGYLIRAGLY